MCRRRWGKLEENFNYSNLSIKKQLEKYMIHVK